MLPKWNRMLHTLSWILPLWPKTFAILMGGTFAAPAPKLHQTTALYETHVLVYLSFFGLSCFKGSNWNLKILFEVSRQDHRHAQTDTWKDDKRQQKDSKKIANTTELRHWGIGRECGRSSGLKWSLFVLHLLCNQHQHYPTNPSIKYVAHIRSTTLQATELAEHWVRYRKFFKPLPRSSPFRPFRCIFGLAWSSMLISLRFSAINKAPWSGAKDGLPVDTSAGCQRYHR
jgi:hypothetical protein